MVRATRVDEHGECNRMGQFLTGHSLQFVQSFSDTTFYYRHIFIEQNDGNQENVSHKLPILSKTCSGQNFEPIC